MFLDDLFQVSAVRLEGDTLRATLLINRGHRIFEGHFPGQPVVPGVCMMQVVKDLLETHVTRARTRLVRAAQAKFLAMIDPRVTGTVEAELTVTRGEDIGVTARLYDQATTFFKYNAVFRTLT